MRLVMFLLSLQSFFTLLPSVNLSNTNKTSKDASSSLKYISQFHEKTFFKMGPDVLKEIQEDPEYSEMNAKDLKMVFWTNKRDFENIYNAFLKTRPAQCSSWTGYCLKHGFDIFTILEKSGDLFEILQSHPNSERKGVLGSSLDIILFRPHEFNLPQQFQKYEKDVLEGLYQRHAEHFSKTIINAMNNRIEKDAHFYSNEEYFSIKDFFENLSKNHQLFLPKERKNCIKLFTSLINDESMQEGLGIHDASYAGNVEEFSQNLGPLSHVFQEKAWQEFYKNIPHTLKSPNTFDILQATFFEIFKEIKIKKNNAAQSLSSQDQIDAFLKTYPLIEKHCSSALIKRIKDLFSGTDDFFSVLPQHLSTVTYYINDKETEKIDMSEEERANLQIDALFSVSLSPSCFTTQIEKKEYEQLREALKKIR